MRQVKNLLSVSYTLLFLLCVTITSLHAQSWQWGSGSAGVLSDGYSVATDKQGNVFVGGSTITTGIITFGSISLSLTSASISDNQAVWAKYDPAGVALWAAGTSNGSANLISLTTDSAGNLIVFGSFYTPSITIGSTVLSNPNGSIAPYTFPTSYAMYFLARYSPSGILLWALADGNCHYSEYAMPPYASPWGSRSAATDASGDIYITSSFAKPAINIGGTMLTNRDPTGNTDDIFIAKYNAMGTFLWAQTIGGTDDDNVLAIVAVPSGDVYVTGSFLSPAIVVGASTITDPLGAPPSVTQKAFIARLSASGTKLWADAPVTTRDSYGISLAADADNNVYMVGSFGDTTFNMDGLSLTRAYPPDYYSYNYYMALFLTKISPLNNALWGKTISSPHLSVNAYGVATSCSSVWVAANYGDTADIDGHKVPTLPAGPFGDTVSELLVAEYTSSGSFSTYTALNRYSGGSDMQADIACTDSGVLYLGSTYDNAVTIGPDVLTTLGQHHLMVGRFFTSGPDTSSDVMDTVLCNIASYTLSATSGYNKYLWDNASTLPWRSVSSSGSYFAICSGGTCGSYVLVDSFNVSVGHGDTVTHALDTAFCLSSGLLTLSGPSGYTSYLWSTGDTDSQLSVSLSGTYYVNAYGVCEMASDTITVIAHASPEVDIQQTPSLCNGTLLSISDTVYHTTIWNTGNTADQLTVYASGNYWVQVTNVYGCTTKDTITVTVDTSHYHFLTHITPGSTIPLGSSIQLEVMGGLYYMWIPDDGSLSNDDINDPLATPHGPTLYTVVSLDTNGCRDTATVFIDCTYGNVSIPSAFSPNGDGLNDRFRIVNLGLYKVDCMQIYNRWGQMVYTSADNTGWDGTFKGIPQNMDTYYYLIILSTPGNVQVVLKGDVTLLR